MARTTVRGACPHDCPDTCGVLTEVEDGRAAAFRADPDHPVTDGWLCIKVRNYLEHVHHPDRLLHPLRRVGPKGSGRWERISWDDAIGAISARWNAIAAECGAEAILPYSYSGTLGLVQSGVAAARLWNRLGASRLQRSICDAAARTAVLATLGERLGVPYHHVPDSRLVVVWGHNPVSTAPHFVPFLKRAKGRGCRVVVIDPRRTRTARMADLHLAPRPGTDGAVALAMGHVLVREGLHDEAWLERNTKGWPELRARLEEFPPERAAAVSGLDADAIERLARDYATTRPSLLKIADGLQRHRGGGQAVRAICTLPALTGQYGVRGGGLAYSVGGYLTWDADAVGPRDGCPPPGRVVNMNRLGAALLGEVRDPPIRSLYVFASNPAAIAPNAGAVVRGLQREDVFTVVHELFMTDTADLADIVLPATSQLEQVDLHKPYGHLSLLYNARAIDPVGECRSNWDVMRALAAALGFDEPWLRESADEVIDGIVTATAATQPALEGISPERLRAEGVVPMAVPDEAPFADLRFPTPSGKVELLSEGLAARGHDPLPGHAPAEDDAGPPVWANAGAAFDLVTPAAHHFVTSSLANHPRLLGLERGPFVEVHPDDAAVHGIADGDEVELANSRGACRLHVVVTDAVPPGVLAAPKGHWARRGDGRNVNWTTSDALADFGGQSTFHCNRVWMRQIGS
jgi:anaerobic selenocysteine-containing dehydrogenase